MLPKDQIIDLSNEHLNWEDYSRDGAFRMLSKLLSGLFTAVTPTPSLANSVCE